MDQQAFLYRVSVLPHLAAGSPSWCERHLDVTNGISAMPSTGHWCRADATPPWGAAPTDTIEVPFTLPRCN